MGKLGFHLVIRIFQPVDRSSGLLEAGEHCVRTKGWSSLNDMVVTRNGPWVASLGLRHGHEGEHLVSTLKAKEARFGNGICHPFLVVPRNHHVAHLNLTSRETGANRLFHIHIQRKDRDVFP